MSATTLPRGRRARAPCPRDLHGGACRIQPGRVVPMAPAMTCGRFAGPLTMTLIHLARCSWSSTATGEMPPKPMEGVVAVAALLFLAPRSISNRA
eukprot:8697566-Pyramimonas_sp.AAC.1